MSIQKVIKPQTCGKMLVRGGGGGGAGQATSRREQAVFATGHHAPNVDCCRWTLPNSCNATPPGTNNSHCKPEPELPLLKQNLFWEVWKEQINLPTIPHKTSKVANIPLCPLCLQKTSKVIKPKWVVGVGPWLDGLDCQMVHDDTLAQRLWQQSPKSENREALH